MSTKLWSWCRLTCVRKGATILEYLLFDQLTVLAQAFPDFTDIREYALFAREGAKQGGLVFMLTSGQIAPPTLHFIALSFGMIGFILLILNRKWHRPGVIISWIFLVFVTIVGPINSRTFFTDVPDMLSGSGTPYKAFTPQMVVMDATSRLHRAIYASFFESGELRNLSETLDAATALGALPSITFEERDDLKMQTKLFEFMGCGDINTIAKTPYYTPAAAFPANSPVRTTMISEEEDQDLANRTFTLKLVDDAIIAAREAYREKRAHAPFAVAFNDATMLEDVLAASGTDATTVSALSEKYRSLNAAERFRLNRTTLHQLYEMRDEVTNDAQSGGDAGSQWPGNGTGPTGNSSYNYGNGTTAAGNSEGNIIRGHINTIGFRGGANPFTASDPIDERFESDEYDPADIPATRNTLEASELLDAPVALGLTFDSIYAYKGYHLHSNLPPKIPYPNLVPGNNQIINSNEEVLRRGGRAAFVVYNNCKQFQQDLHLRMTEYIVANADFPRSNTSGNNTVTNTVGTLGSITDNGGSVFTGSMLNKNGLSSITGMDQFPHSEPRDSLEKQREPNEYSALRKVHDNEVNKFINPATAVGNNTAPATINNTLDNDEKEYIRQKLIQSMIMTGVRKTSGFSSLNYSLEQVRFNQNMAAQAEGANTAENFQLGSWLHGVVDWVSGAALVVGAVFKGAEVKAYIRFMKLMVGVALLLVFIVTPLLFLMGILIPGNAPGVLMLTIGAVLVLKSVPIVFVVIDVVMSYANEILTSANGFGMVDRALMIYVMASAYTGVVMATLFVLFKSGDPSQLSQLGMIDKAAGDIADKGLQLTKALGMTAASIASGGVGGAIGGAAKAKALGQSGMKGAFQGGTRQAMEVVSRSSSNIPIVGQVMKEANPVDAAREGSAYVGAVNKAGGSENYKAMEAAQKRQAAQGHYEQALSSGTHQLDLEKRGQSDAAFDTAMHKGHTAAVESGAQGIAAKNLNAKAGEIHTENVIATKAAAQEGALEGQAMAAEKLAKNPDDARLAEHHNAMKGVSSTQEAAGVHERMMEAKDNEGNADGAAYTAGVAQAVEKGFQEGLRGVKLEATISPEEMGQVAADKVSGDMRGIATESAKSQAITDQIDKENTDRIAANEAEKQFGPVQPPELLKRNGKDGVMMAGVKGDGKLAASKTLAAKDWDVSMDDAIKAEKFTQSSQESSIQTRATLQDAIGEGLDAVQLGEGRRKMGDMMRNYANTQGISTSLAHDDTKSVIVDSAGTKETMGIGSSYKEMNSSFIKTANKEQGANTPGSDKAYRGMASEYTDFITALGDRENLKGIMPDGTDAKAIDIIKKVPFGKGGSAWTVDPELAGKVSENANRRNKNPNGSNFADTLKRMHNAGEITTNNELAKAGVKDRVKEGSYIVEAWDKSDSNDPKNPMGKFGFAHGTKFSSDQSDEDAGNTITNLTGKD